MATNTNITDLDIALAFISARYAFSGLGMAHGIGLQARAKRGERITHPGERAYLASLERS